MYLKAILLKSFYFPFNSHHATGSHPYSQIMLNYHQKNGAEKNVRILGLTASIVHKKCNLKTFNANSKKLEEKFG